MIIIGVDEANYSPSIAGDCPVVAFTSPFRIKGVKDSKQMTQKQRIKIFKGLQIGSSYNVALATVNEINRIGIYEARNNAIIQAVMGLLKPIPKLYRYPQVVIDGYFSKKWISTFEEIFGCHTECQINGDEKVYEVAAASIIARVYADSLFEGFGKFYPGFRLEKNHGSPDKVMYEKLRKDGPSPYHRVGKYGRSWWKKIFEKGERGEINGKEI